MVLAVHGGARRSVITLCLGCLGCLGLLPTAILRLLALTLALLLLGSRGGVGGGQGGGARGGLGGGAVGGADALGDALGDAVQEAGAALGLRLVGAKAAVEVRVVGVVVVVAVGLLRAGLAEDLRAQGVRLEGLHMELLRVGQAEQHVRVGVASGDQVGASLAESQVEDLDVVLPLARGQLARRGGHLGGVLGGGHQDGDAAVEHLVRPVEDHVLVSGRHHVVGDAVAAAQDGTDGEGLGHGGLLTNGGSVPDDTCAGAGPGRAGSVTCRGGPLSLCRAPGPARAPGARAGAARRPARGSAATAVPPRTRAP